MKDGDKDSGSAKSAISPGQITITNPEGQNQDLAALNHDTTNTNDEIKVLPDLQAKLNEQLKTQQEWTQAAANMATAVKDAADFMRDKVAKTDAERALRDEGGAARAALHAIAGGLLGGVNGVDSAIKSAIAADVSTLIAPYINDIVKEAVAQSGLTGEDAKRMSDTLTSSIVLGLLASAGGSDAAAYASNEIKYNYLKDDQWKKYLDEFESCGTNEECKKSVYQKYDNISNEWKKCKTSACIKEYWDGFVQAQSDIDNDPELKQRINKYNNENKGIYSSIWRIQSTNLDEHNITLENYQIAQRYAGLSYCEQNPGNGCQKIGEDEFASKHFDKVNELVAKDDYLQLVTAGSALGRFGKALAGLGGLFGTGTGGALSYEMAVNNGLVAALGQNGIVVVGGGAIAIQNAAQILYNQSANGGEGSSGAGGSGSGSGNIAPKDQDYPNGQTRQEFEENLSKIGNPGERVAQVRQTARQAAENRGMVRDNRLSRMNNRDVYKGNDGNYYSVDTRHAAFEKINPRGQHLGEVDFNLNPNKPADPSGGHGLKGL